MSRYYLPQWGHGIFSGAGLVVQSDSGRRRRYHMRSEGTELDLRIRRNSYIVLFFVSVFRIVCTSSVLKIYVFLC